MEPQKINESIKDVVCGSYPWIHIKVFLRENVSPEEIYSKEYLDKWAKKYINSIGGDSGKSN